MLQLAKETAIAGVVLLKNMNNLLPLSPALLAGRNIAVVGPCANNTFAQLGGYVNSHPLFVRTPFQGLTDSLPMSKVLLDAACPDTDCPSFSQSAVTLASNADYVVVVLGTNGFYKPGQNNESAACGCPHGNAIEGECCDRMNTELPGVQLAFLQAIAALGRPLIVILVSGGSLDADWLLESPAVGAIIHAPFLGMMAGAALGDIITGVASPSGRTTLTWYQNLTAALPPLGDYSGLYQSTYRYVPASVPVTFPFGYGLSYAQFQYLGEPVFSPAVARACDIVNVTVVIANTATVDGFEVVQVYGTILNASVAPVPTRQLLAFSRVWIKENSQVSVTLSILPQTHAVYIGDAAVETVEPGPLDVWVGSSSDPSYPGAYGLLGRFSVTGPAVSVRECTK